MYSSDCPCVCEVTRKDAGKIYIFTSMYVTLYLTLIKCTDSELNTFLVSASFPNSGMILGLRPANEIRRYFVATSLIGWVQTWNQPCNWM